MKCTGCQNSMTQGRTTLKFEVGRAEISVTKVPTLRCRACRLHLVKPGDQRRAEMIAARELASSGAATGTQFKFMRKALGLTQVELAKLWGLGRAETVSDWERKSKPVDREHVALLAAMIEDALENRTNTKDRLLAASAPHSLGKHPVPFAA